MSPGGSIHHFGMNLKTSRRKVVRIGDSILQRLLGVMVSSASLFPLFLFSLVKIYVFI